MLWAYVQREGGSVYAEVPVGGKGGAGDWPTGCTIRRIDGVRVLAGAEPRVVRFSTRDRQHLNALRASAVELIEVKPRLNRGSIGQIIAGRLMFGRQYRVTIGRSVIICGVGDTALEWVCGQEGISVEVVEDTQ